MINWNDRLIMNRPTLLFNCSTKLATKPYGEEHHENNTVYRWNMIRMNMHWCVLLWSSVLCTTLDGDGCSWLWRHLLLILRLWTWSTCNKERQQSTSAHCPRLSNKYEPTLIDFKKYPIVIRVQCLLRIRATSSITSTDGRCNYLENPRAGSVSAKMVTSHTRKSVMYKCVIFVKVTFLARSYDCPWNSVYQQQKIVLSE